MDVVPQTQASLRATETDGVTERQVIGIYGLPGCGKTYLLNQLRQTLDNNHYKFIEGSQLIDSVVPGGLGAFQTLDEPAKTRWREVAINQINNDEVSEAATAIVAGHYMFWKEHEERGTAVMTQKDLETYTHILYLDVPVDILMQRRNSDTTRARPNESTLHLTRWQDIEKAELRQKCYENGILFHVLCATAKPLDQVLCLLRHLPCLTEQHNCQRTRAELDNILAEKYPRWKTLMVIDGDKTLSAVDTGKLFWNEVPVLWPSGVQQDPLKDIFSSNLAYTHGAFVQAMLLYEETFEHDQFVAVCDFIASKVSMYPEFVSLLQAIEEHEDTGAVIVTCGLAHIWNEVLRRHGLSHSVRVIGGGRISNAFVVTGDTKAELVSHARNTHDMHVYAFGDSPLDLDMLKEADQAIVVVGKEEDRSKSMEESLLHMITNNSLAAFQVVFPDYARPRLNPHLLPVLKLTNAEFVEKVFAPHSRSTELKIVHATIKNAAKLLMTPMRDARVTGPRLREAHQLVGRYLATEFLSSVVGLEEYPILHVQGHEVAGHRLLHEDKTLIVPLMRGGEPMAFGVSDALPSAKFLHAHHPEDIRNEHIQGQLCIILTDSVVNSGKSVLEFVRHIRKMHATIRIVVMAGVVQKDAIARLEEEPGCSINFKLITLRLSENKFTGRGGTDTGNRLFNTTHLN